MFVLMDLATAPVIALEDSLVAAHERLNATYCELFDLIVSYERREAYLVDGARSMVDWLSYRLGYSEHSARELCRMAAAVQYLPAIYEAFRAGLLTLDKLRWLTEFCTPPEDAEWAHEGVGLSAGAVRTYALHRRRLSRQGADRRFKRRYLRIVPDPEEGTGRIWGRLSDAELMVVRRAIERRADAQPPDANTGVLVPFEQRCADALTEICSLSLGADDNPDRASVVCHVDAEVLASEDGVATLEGGMPVAAETARRLVCDGRLQVMVHDGEGHPIGVGKMTRVVPHYLRRALVHRDGGCVWPGCPNTRWLHAHHVVHVAHGGPTDEDNLLMLCGWHHRCVHEGGFKMRGRPGRGLRIFRPDGRPLEAGPKGARPRRRSKGARGP
jgi:hypothetical protein